MNATTGKLLDGHCRVEVEEATSSLELLSSKPTAAMTASYQYT
jgi:hypothetical protein